MIYINKYQIYYKIFFYQSCNCFKKNIFCHEYNKYKKIDIPLCKDFVSTTQYSLLIASFIRGSFRAIYLK